MGGVNLQSLCSLQNCLSGSKGLHLCKFSMEVVHTDFGSCRGDPTLLHWLRKLRSKDGRTGTKARQISVSYRVPLETKVCSPQQTKNIILSKNNRSALTLWSFLRHLILGLLLVDFLKSITHGNITYSLHELDSALWNCWWDKLECAHLFSLQRLATERCDSSRITGSKVH